MSVKITFKTKFKDITDKLKGDLKKIIEKREVELIGNEMIRLIVGRSRVGRGARGEGGAEYKFPNLKDTYIEARKRLKRKGKLSDVTRPTLSNITLSGALLDSVRLRITGQAQGVVEIPTGTHPSGISYRKLAGILEDDLSRPFFYLSDKQTRVMESFVKRLLREKLRRNL